MAFIDQMIKRNKEISLQLLIKTIRNCFRYNITWIRNVGSAELELNTHNDGNRNNENIHRSR